MQHAPITTPITDKLASMTWIRWFRQLVDRVDEIKGTADAPAWETITGKPTEFPPSEHRHEWTDLDDVPTEFPPEPHTHSQYLTEETDPTVPAHVKDITQADIIRWDEADQFVTAGGCQISGVTGAQIGDLSLVSETIYPPDGFSFPYSSAPDEFTPFAIIGGVAMWVKTSTGGIYSRSEAGVFTYWKGSGIVGSVFVKMSDDLVVEFAGAEGFVYEIRLGTFSRTARAVAPYGGYSFYPANGLNLDDTNILCVGPDYAKYNKRPYIINTSTWARTYLTGALEIDGNPVSIVQDDGVIYIVTQYSDLYKLNADYSLSEHIVPAWQYDTYSTSSSFAQDGRLYFSFDGGAPAPYSAGWWWYDTITEELGYYTSAQFRGGVQGIVIRYDDGSGFYSIGGTNYYSFTPPSEIIYSLSVPAFRVRMFDDSAFLTLAEEFDIPAQEIPVPGFDQRYYLCAQRSGSTVTLVSVPQTDVYTINMSNIVPLWRFEIHGTDLRQIHYDNMGDGLPNKQEFAQLRTEPYRLAVEGGLSGTLTAGRSLTLTAAEVFFGHHRVSVLAFDSDIDLVHDYYHVSSAWDDTEYSGTWEWDNLQYDNGTDLVTLGNNKWGAIFVYRSIGDSKEIFVVRGQTEANHIEGARLIGIPAIPEIMQWHCMLVGRILFEKSATTGIFEEYRPASFIRAATPSLSLNDLTDVDTAGAVTGDILVLQSDGIWRPQAP